MVDPLSATASVCALCEVAAQIIKGFSNFIDDDVRLTLTEAQAYDGDMAFQYISFGHKTSVIRAPRICEVLEAWKTDFINFMQECTETMTELQKIVDKINRSET